jgi:hypothetical protein
MCYEGEWALAIKYIPRFKAIKGNYGIKMMASKTFGNISFVLALLPWS